MAKKLLVADDSPTIHKVVGLAFAGEDIQVATAAGGDGLIDVIRTTRPDLLLVDALLPGVSGYEICRSVKSDPELVSMPVVLLTGLTEAFDEEEAGRVGSSAHLIKPFDTAELIGTVHGLLAAAGAPEPPSRELVSARTRESFLGSGSVLDVFGPARKKLRKAPAARVEQPTAVALAEPLPPPPPPEPAAEEVPAAAPAASQVIPFPGPKVNEATAAPVELPDEILDAIAQRAVRQMSADVIREVAWEIIPDLAEIIIRQYLDERGVPKK